MRGADKTVRLYKSSTMALGRSTPALQLPNEDDDNISRTSFSERESWEDDDLMQRGQLLVFSPVALTQMADRLD